MTGKENLVSSRPLTMWGSYHRFRGFIPCFYLLQEATLKGTASSSFPSSRHISPPITLSAIPSNTPRRQEEWVEI